jgi:hypothetical protein
MTKWNEEKQEFQKKTLKRNMSNLSNDVRGKNLLLIKF